MWVWPTGLGLRFKAMASPRGMWFNDVGLAYALWGQNVARDPLLCRWVCGTLSACFQHVIRGERERSPPLPEIMQSRFPHLGNSHGSAKHGVQWLSLAVGEPPS